MRFSSALLLLVCPNLALAATLQVGPGQTYATVGDALGDAQDGDVIEVAPGTYTEPLEIEVDVEIVGTGGAAVTTLEWADEELINASGVDLTLRGFTLAPDGARALDFRRGTLVVEDVVVKGHTSEREGAGLRIREAVATLTSLRVEDVITTQSGAALYLEDALVEVIDGEFLRNVGLRGGAIFVENSELDLQGTFFQANSTNRPGGWTSPDGGALAAEGSAIAITDCVFRTNVAEEVGGALNLVAGSSAAISGSIFHENEGTYGGAVYLGSTGSLEVEDTVFQDNRAVEGSGGAIRWRSDGGDPSIHIVESTFLRNTAPLGAGGGLAYATNNGQRGATSITDSSFTGNTAAIGGAVSIVDLLDVSGVRNLFCANEASDAAGVRLQSTGAAGHVWSNNVFNANVATGSGGAMSLTFGASAGVLNNTFVGNQAADGGAIYVEASAPAVVNNVFAWTSGGYAVTATSSVVALDYNAWFDNAPADVGAELTATGPNAVSADPLLTFVDDDVCANDMLAPLAGSPLIDAGDPSVGDDPDGSPPDIGAFGGPSADLDLLLDEDGDGYNKTVDCDDANDAIHPGAEEVCNGVDDDCNGHVDDDATDAATFYLDADGDGYGGPSSVQTCGEAPADHVELGGDCDDANSAVSPGAAEICNDLDDNCDGQVDEGLILEWYDDDDKDGFGDPDDVELTCEEIPGRVHNGDDCDDHDDTVYPGAPDEHGDGVDSDCDGADGVAGPTEAPEKLVAGCTCSHNAGGSGGAGLFVLLGALIAGRRRSSARS